MYDYHDNRKLHNNEITVNSITVTVKMITIIIQINCLGLLDIRINLCMQVILKSECTYIITCVHSESIECIHNHVHTHIYIYIFINTYMVANSMLVNNVH